MDLSRRRPPRRPRDVTEADEKRYSTTQFELIRRRFLRNRAALVGGGVVSASTWSRCSQTSWRRTTSTIASTAPSTFRPSRSTWSTTARSTRTCSGVTITIDPESLRRTYAPDPTIKIPIEFFVERRPVQAVRPVSRPTCICLASRQPGLRRFPARHRSTGPRPVFAAARRQPDLAHHRAGRGDPEPADRLGVGRRERLLRRPDRQPHAAHHRGHPLVPGDSALDGAGGGVSTAVAALAGVFRDQRGAVADWLDLAGAAIARQGARVTRGGVRARRAARGGSDRRIIITI